MGVDYDVGNDSLRSEGHIFLGHNHSYDAFLSVARGKLVTQFWDALVTDSDLYKLASFTCFCDKDVVYNAGFSWSHIN